MKEHFVTFRMRWSCSKVLPYSQERARRELDIQIDYGLALLATKGLVCA